MSSNCTFDQGNRRARKEHRCDYCYGPIPKGETYCWWSGIFDGEFQSNKLHLECDEQRQLDDPYGDGWMPGEAEMPERVKQLIALGAPAPEEKP